MADDRMAALELLRKAAAHGDRDFLREGLGMLTQLVMDVEVTAQIGATHMPPVADQPLDRSCSSRSSTWRKTSYGWAPTIAYRSSRT